MSAERCKACGQPTVKWGQEVFPGECDGDSGCLETQLDAKCRRIDRLEQENAALRELVTYVLRGDSVGKTFGVPEGYCIMSLGEPREQRTELSDENGQPTSR